MATARTSPSVSLPSVFEYGDFRRYLADYQTARVAQEPSFTRSRICQLLGLPNTRSFFNDVIKGKELTDVFVERFVRVLALTPAQARYFRVLVRLNQATNPEDHELLFDQLISLNQTPHRVLDADAFSYYRDWRHAAVRAVLDTMDFRGDYKALAQALCPAISVKQARDSVRLLTKLGLAGTDTHGRVRPTDKIVTTRPYLKDSLILQYQLECLFASRTALTHPGRRARNCYTNTVSISAEGYRRVERRLQRFKSDVRAIIHKDNNPADRVYQLNIHLFPVTR